MEFLPQAKTLPFSWSYVAGMIRRNFDTRAHTVLMDPLSIAASAAGLTTGCATILKTLYVWIDETVDVDENVSDLCDEITTLSRVLKSVSNATSRVP